MRTRERVAWRSILVHEIRITRIDVADISPLRPVSVKGLVSRPGIESGGIVLNQRAVPNAYRLRTAAAWTAIGIWPPVDVENVGCNSLLPRINPQIGGKARLGRDKRDGGEDNQACKGS